MSGMQQLFLGGSYGLPVPPTVEYLVVAGGGMVNGADYNNWPNFAGALGGGGAGGYRTSASFAVSAGAYTVTVGGGGSNSVFGSVTANAGGVARTDGLFANGGSGAGGSAYTQNGWGEATNPGGAGNTPSTSPSQGNNGAAGTTTTPYGSQDTVGGGGGGGSGGAGGTSISGGTGGAGTSNSITGSAVTYAKGGNGSDGNGNKGANGSPNTGNGANAGTFSNNENEQPKGGSGIVVIKYSDAYKAAATTGSPSITVSGGFRIYTFTGSGSITW